VPGQDHAALWMAPESVAASARRFSRPHEAADVGPCQVEHNRAAPGPAPREDICHSAQKAGAGPIDDRPAATSRRPVSGPFSGHRSVGERKAMGTATGSSTLNRRWALLGSASRYSRGSCEGGVSRLLNHFARVSEILSKHVGILSRDEL
jgi:hypothetical protein